MGDHPKRSWSWFNFLPINSWEFSGIFPNFRVLNQLAQAGYKSSYGAVAWEEQRVALLREIQQTDFFGKLRSDLIVSLYNNPEVWPKFGYEGSSAEHGGYINRGFDDIDWLS
jgi:hypothetical protein